MKFQASDGQSQITGDFSGLEKLVAKLKEKHFVEVGYFKEAKAPDGSSVAGYMAPNEFGAIIGKKKIPKRSSIRMPLQVKSKKIQNYVYLKAKKHLEAGDILAIFEDIGIAAESVIQEAFDTRGFGTWPPNAEMTIALKGSDAPLIDKGLARKAVTYRTDKK